jgi:ASC-1-like (ASCH) protein
MPLVATTIPAFNALLADITHLLRPFGRKLYVHLVPSVDETIILQRQGWILEAVLPAAYHPLHVTQQWGLDVSGENFMRTMRIKQYYLDKIKGGQKTLEVRVGYDSIKTIKAGDRIRLMSRTEVIVQVKNVRHYKTFDEMLEHEEASRIVPGLTRSESLKLLQEIYYPEREKLGVIVLELEVESKSAQKRPAHGES